MDCIRDRSYNPVNKRTGKTSTVEEDGGHLVAVDVVEAVEQLLHDLLDLAEAELDVGVGEQAGQVVLAKVEHQVERRLELVQLRRLGAADLDQVHHVLVVQQLQDADLAQRRYRKLRPTQIQRQH